RAGLKVHDSEMISENLSGICPEMLEVAEEANRAGDYSLAVEIYSSQKADSLARAGRISEALDSYCTAANLGKLRPDELPLLVETIARTLREKELGITGTLNGHLKNNSSSSSGDDDIETDGDGAEDEVLDLFSCRLCRCLLHEPTTVDCGHTFCKSCLEDDSVKDCVQCKLTLNKKGLPPNGRRLNVVLSGLLDKLFATESKARKYWIEGELLWKKQSLSDALEKYNAALDLGKRRHGFLCVTIHLSCYIYSARGTFCNKTAVFV
uniref:RING-type domain-containing protein n=1 Tax=Labrus bergylta TaxID=56723 RepID=A0A3Q3MIF4_9LABR